MDNDTRLDQRIRYLIEHGGIWDDPLADIRRAARIGQILGGLALALHLVQLLELFR